MKKIALLSSFVIFLLPGAIGQTADVLKIRNYCKDNANSILDTFVHLLSFPNVAADPESLQKNCDVILNAMKNAGIPNAYLLHGVTPGTAPVVYGEVITPGASRTIIFYAHYDGQPVNPAQWAEGLSPFQPQLVNGIIGQGGSIIRFPGATEKYDPSWRIYARGASDDKAGVMAIINAYKAIKSMGLPLSCNIKFFFEGEEEAGSPHLHEILKKYDSLLRSDLWIICDGPVHQSGKKQIVFGVRGDAQLDLTVYASKRPLHSGHYGNWAPNPAMMLAKLLASMKDDNGRVTIKGFYDDVTPLSALEKKAIQEIPSVDGQMKNELGIIVTDYKGRSLPEAISLPSLNINGMQSGNVGKMASNVIPTTATAVIDLRLVPGNDWQRQQQKVIEHIKAQGYYVTDQEPTDEERKKYPKIIKILRGTDGYNAQRTPLELPLAKDVIAAVKSTTNEQVVLLPTMGGSLPLSLIEKYLQARIITVPVANHDNNQHAENENIRLQNFWNGIETMAAIMLMK